MTDRNQLTVWVSDAQLERWDEKKDELGFSSRGEMIRRGVESFIAIETRDENEESSEVVEEKFDEFADKIDRVRAEVMDVRREQLAQDDVDDVAEEVAYRLTEVLESDLMDTLPEDYKQELESEIEELDDKME